MRPRDVPRENQPRIRRPRRAREVYQINLRKPVHQRESVSKFAPTETEGTIMKKITTLTLIILLGIVSCSPIKQERYQSGTYTAVNSGCGYIVTEDGNVWSYFNRAIPSGFSVLVTFSDEGTEEIEDDVITNVVEK
jgi:hypothetical protein